MEQFAEVYERDAAPTFKPSAAKAVRSISRSYIIPTIGRYRLDEVAGQIPQLMVNAMQQRILRRLCCVCGRARGTGAS